LRSIGREFGVTTGRPRRTGWFDAVIARYAARVNGLTDFFLTKLDVLTGLERIPICVGYRVNGRTTAELPMTQTEFHHAFPVYEELPGWDEDISVARSFDDLPKNARLYVKTVEELAGAPIGAVGVGPDREQTLILTSFTDRQRAP
jgi:adenylosuccinate synthase